MNVIERLTKNFFRMTSDSPIAQVKHAKQFYLNSLSSCIGHIRSHFVISMFECFELSQNRCQVKIFAKRSY